MHALIVVAHPEPHSLTHSIANKIAEGITAVDSSHSCEIGDLTAEGFDPRFCEADLTVHRTQATPPADVVAEQARIEKADALVLVFPVYWWSMPALLKGWIDRVFSNGWAFDFSQNGKLVKKLGKLKVHLVAVGGSDAATYAHHGYLNAMEAQIDHGIFNYCGATVYTSKLLLNSEIQDPQIHLAAASHIGYHLFDNHQNDDTLSAA